VSTTFYPNAPVDSAPSDVLVVTADGVWFYLHFHRLQGASTNGFGGHIPTLTAEPVYVCEQSTILNLVVHTIYGLPFTQFIPSFVNLFEAVDVLDRYGALQSDIMKPGKPLYEVLVTHACAGRAFDVYALAAHYNLEELAVSSSLYLHGFCLSLLTDEDAERIGPVYLRRLFFLHLGRSDALKRLLLTGPTGHPSTTSCNVAAQTSVTRAWALAAAYLSWEARAGMSWFSSAGLCSSFTRTRCITESALQRILVAGSGSAVHAMSDSVEGACKAVVASMVACQADHMTSCSLCPAFSLRSRKNMSYSLYEYVGCLSHSRSSPLSFPNYIGPRSWARSLPLRSPKDDCCHDLGRRLSRALE
jgi:hypothetical protein